MSGMDARHNTLLLTKRGQQNIARLLAQSSTDVVAMSNAARRFFRISDLSDVRRPFLPACNGVTDAMPLWRGFIYPPSGTPGYGVLLSRTFLFAPDDVNAVLFGTSSRQHQLTHSFQRLGFGARAQKRADNADDQIGAFSWANISQYLVAPSSSYLLRVKPAAHESGQQLGRPGHSASAITLCATQAAVPLATFPQRKRPPFSSRYARLTVNWHSLAARELESAAPVPRLPAAADCRGKSIRQPCEKAILVEQH